MTHQHSLSKECVVCGEIFYKPYFTGFPEWKGRRYCSNACVNVGRVAWNKGKKKWWKSPGDFKKGCTSWNKGLRGYMIGEKSPHWKGDNVGNAGLHEWIRRRLKYTGTCEFCGDKPGLAKDGRRRIHLANKSHTYKRDLSDWFWLCIPCHKRYDLKRKAL